MASYEEHEVDIPYVVQRLYPTPDYNGLADTYAELLETWEDVRGVPTWANIEVEWDVCVVEEAALLNEMSVLKKEMLNLVEGLSYSKIDMHIENVFGALTTAQKESLKRLYRVVLFLAKDRTDTARIIKSRSIKLGAILQ